MKNDLTALSFTGDQNRVNFHALQYLCDTITAAAEQTATVLVSGGVSVKLDVVASPQKGSITFLFDPQVIFIADFSMLPAVANSSVKEALESLGNMAAIGAFVWATLFGGRGIFDLFKRKEPPPVADNNSDLRMFLIAKALERESLRGQLQTVIHAAATAGVNAVTIRVGDSEAVVLWDQSSRREAGLLFTRVPTRRSAPEFLRRVANPILKGSYRGKSVSIFIADGFSQGGGSARYAVIWASSNPIPDPEASTATFVQSEFLHSATDVELHEDIPRDFEGAEAVVLVRQAARMA